MIEIRNANEADLEQILEIYNYEIVNTTSVYHYNPYDLDYLKKWFKEKQLNDFPLLVSMDGSILTGFASYGRFRDRPAYQYTKEHSVYIHPSQKRKGYASILMKSLIDIAKKNNVHSLIGGIDAENSGSIDFHERLGFSEVAHIKEVGHKFERWLDLKFYQLIIS